MKVRELIAKLLTSPMEAEVRFVTGEDIVEDAECIVDVDGDESDLTLRISAE